MKSRDGIAARFAADNRFCVVCLALPDSQAREIPSRLRALVGHQLFATKNQRMGKVIRVVGNQVGYYGVDDKSVQTARL